MIETEAKPNSTIALGYAGVTIHYGTQYDEDGEPIT